jgi:putative transposase
MATRKRHTPEQVVRKLAQADGMLGRGQGRRRRLPRAPGLRADVLPLAYQFGGLKADDAKRLKDLERENARTCRAALHPTRRTLAQRLRRVVQQQGSRRMPEHQHLPVPRAGQRCHRRLEAGPQPPPTPRLARLPGSGPLCDQLHPQVKRTGCGLFVGNRPGRSERFMHGQEGLAAGRCAAVDGDVNEHFLDLTHCCAAG